MITDEFKILEVQLALEGRVYALKELGRFKGKYLCFCDSKGHICNVPIIVISDEFPSTFAVSCEKSLECMIEYGWKIYTGE